MAPAPVGSSLLPLAESLDSLLALRGLQAQPDLLVDGCLGSLSPGRVPRKKGEKSSEDTLESSPEKRPPELTTPGVH